MKKVLKFKNFKISENTGSIDRCMFKIRDEQLFLIN